ncbi:DUF2953 domain-containing protein [Thermoanaerobacter thermocopriae]|uniref:DUF2953 domain-containing protein n=1 Tax=Thermoanaerobacter thermocopriae TaxID=29350 RepID=UPI00048F383B|nr:DUF2953 domain-containing protein [Thermoanaerobacter thermocopriae]
MRYLSAVFILLIFLILLYFVPIKIKLKAYKEEKNISLEITTNIFLVNFLTIKIQKENEKEQLDFKIFGIKMHKSEDAQKLNRLNKEKKFSTLDIRCEDFFKIIEFLKDMLKDAIVHKFYLNIRIGLEDAAWTAILSGFLWGIVYQALMPIYNNATFTAAPEVHITPSYGQNMLEGNLICIFKISCGNIIINGIKFVGSLKGR